MLETSTQKCILLCDDNTINRKLIIAMLTRLPFKVIEAANGQEALACALADHGSIDLVLLDISMKDMSGIDVCRTIRSSLQDQRRPLPVIAYTAHAMVDERILYLTAGFDDILTKPTTREDLFSILRRYLPIGTQPAKG
ncbi:MAG: response regulator [Proteobacteria bacterium]|nr:response regulator [Pseudomonadota bacterium]